MKIEKINRDNIKEFIHDIGINTSYNSEKEIINNMFGVKDNDKFLFSFISLSEEDLISIDFGNNKINNSIVEKCISFLCNNLSYNGHLIIQASDDNLINVMDDLYRIKMISVFKGVSISDVIPPKEKYADIDMKSIKYFYSKNDVVCNLYSQNIQDEEIIRLLDDFFNDGSFASVEFIIIPDSLEYMNELGYKCKYKRYIIDYK